MDLTEATLVQLVRLATILVQINGHLHASTRHSLAFDVALTALTRIGVTKSPQIPASLIHSLLQLVTATAADSPRICARLVGEILPIYAEKYLRQLQGHGCILRLMHRASICEATQSAKNRRELLSRSESQGDSCPSDSSSLAESAGDRTPVADWMIEQVNDF